MDALTQFLLLALIVYITAIPGFKLLKRLGMPYWWEILFIIPIVGLLLFIWITAFARWSIKDTENMVESTRSRPPISEHILPGS